MIGSRPEVSEENPRTGDVWYQLVCRILLRHIQSFSGASRHSAEFIEDLVAAITFCESDFVDWLCDWIDLDCEVYLARCRELFFKLPKAIQKRALAGAKEYWKGMKNGSR